MESERIQGRGRKGPLATSMSTSTMTQKSGRRSMRRLSVHESTVCLERMLAPAARMDCILSRSDAGSCGRICQMSDHGQIRVGISGWRFDGWRGSFYPEELTQKRE